MVDRGIRKVDRILFEVWKTDEAATTVWVVLQGNRTWHMCLKSMLKSALHSRQHFILQAAPATLLARLFEVQMRKLMKKTRVGSTICTWRADELEMDCSILA